MIRHYFETNKYIVAESIKKCENALAKNDIIVNGILKSAEMNVGKFNVLERTNPLFMDINVKTALNEKRRTRLEYKEAIASRLTSIIQDALNKFKEKQEHVRQCLCEAKRENANRKLQQMIENGKFNYNTTWRLGNNILRVKNQTL